MTFLNDHTNWPNIKLQQNLNKFHKVEIIKRALSNHTAIKLENNN